MEKMKWLAAGFCALFLSQPAVAQDWPTKPVRFICAFGVGGSSDQIARLMADHLSNALGQPFIVENRPGGTGVVGAAIAAKSPPDGYTYLVEMSRILALPETRTRLERLGMTIRASTPQEFVQHLAAEMRIWGKVVRDNKISAVQ